MENKILHNISIIVAIASNRAIGKDNRLLWHLSDDLKRFKKLTTGHTLIMGRNTFLSLPNGKLPNRRHIVISDIPDERVLGAWSHPCLSVRNRKTLIRSLAQGERLDSRCGLPQAALRSGPIIP